MLKKLGTIAVGLAAIAIVGGLIGVGAEEIAFHRETREDEAVMTRANTEAPRSFGPSAQDKEIVRRATFGLPPYKNAAPQALAADYLGPASPIAAAWFETKDDVQTVLGFYRARLLAQGIPTLEDHTGPSSGYVGYRNPRTHDVHLITAVGDAHGPTRVFVSNGNVEALRTGTAALPQALPRPSGLEAPMVMTFRREGEVESSVVATIPAQTVARMVEFYREAYGREGWTLDAVHTDGASATLESHRPGLRALTRLRKTDTDQVELYARLVTRS